MIGREASERRNPPLGRSGSFPVTIFVRFRRQFAQRGEADPGREGKGVGLHGRRADRVELPHRHLADGTSPLQLGEVTAERFDELAGHNAPPSIRPPGLPSSDPQAKTVDHPYPRRTRTTAPGWIAAAFVPVNRASTKIMREAGSISGAMRSIVPVRSPQPGAFATIGAARWRVAASPEGTAKRTIGSPSLTRRMIGVPGPTVAPASR